MVSTAESQLCLGAAPLQRAVGLRALPTGTEGRGAGQREGKGRRQWENTESSLEEKLLWLLTQSVSGCRVVQLQVVEGSGEAGTAPGISLLSRGGGRAPEQGFPAVLTEGQAMVAAFSRGQLQGVQPGVQPGVPGAVLQSRVPAPRGCVLGQALPPARVSTQPAQGSCPRRCGENLWGEGETPRQGRVLLLPVPPPLSFTLFLSLVRYFLHPPWYCVLWAPELKPGKISSLQRLSSAGTGCPGKWWSHQPWGI